MNSKLKKLIPLLGVAAIIATAPTFAYEEDHTSGAHAGQHAVPPAVHPPGEDNLTFFISGAYTYWVPYQEGMNLAVSAGDPSGDPRGQVFRPNMNGCSGFKAGLGINTNHDGWNAAVGYTWFYNSPGTHVYNIANQGEVTFLWGDDPAVTILGLQGRFSNQFNRIDGVVDRAFYAGHYLAFRPWMGLLGAWDEQNLDADVQGNATTIAFDADTFSLRNRQNWWGIGPYAGIDSTYYFTNEWGLYLSAGGAILLANHDVHERYFTWIDPETEGAHIYSVDTSVNNVEPMLETSLGLRWDSFWTDWALRVEVAWEMQTYFSHNGFETLAGAAGNMGNYSMQGLTAGIRVNF